MFEVIAVDKFGRDPQDNFQVASGGGAVAISIDPSSEIDACWILYPSAPKVGGLRGSGNGYFFFGGVPSNQTQVPMFGMSAVLLSVETPLIGPLPGVVIARPFYLYSNPAASAKAINSAGDFGVGMLALRVWRVMPQPQSVVTTKRAPLRGGWPQLIAGLRRAIIPTFGRKLMRIFASDTAGGTLQLDYGWAAPDNSGNCGFGTTPAGLVVPAAPNFLHTTITDLPDWITIIETGGNVIDDVTVEVYD